MPEPKSVHSGFVWGTADTFIRQGVQFAVGIVLARLLSPEEFGVLGILAIFLSFSDLLTESGFAQALVRRSNPTESEYTSVFYFNLAFSIIIYISLFFSAGFFEDYFDVDGLEIMLKVFMLKVIISSFCFVQSVMLTKNLDFKVFTKITFFSSLTSGFVGIALAYYGFGVWSLIWQSLLTTLLTVLFTNLYKFWLPRGAFSWSSISSLYKVSSFLLLTSLLGRVSNEANSFIIGRYFNAENLGFYTRANSLKNLPAQMFNTILSKVSLPILSKHKDDMSKLFSLYLKLYRTTVFMSSFIMLFLIAIADDLIIVLLGEKWLGTVVLFKYLCVVGILYPVNALNNNLIIAKGETKLIFFLSIVKVLFLIPVLIIGAMTNIEVLVIGTVVVSVLHTMVYCYYSGAMINYSLIQQGMDFFKNSWFLLVVCIVVAYLDVVTIGYFWSLILKSVLFIGLSISFASLIKHEVFIMLKNLSINYLKMLK